MDNKILIADDAEFMRLMLKNTLNDFGYNNVIEANNGINAVEVFKEETPELVIMDITMPNKDGIETLKEIKKIDPNAKVIMCTAMRKEDMVVKSFVLGADDFIMKPFEPERIYQAVKDLLGQDESQ
ncbi:MAG: response regulator [Oscillospiraceae bacterium]